MIKIASFEFRLRSHVSILNTEIINHDDLCVGAEGKNMLGPRRIYDKKIITCETLQTSQHGEVHQIASWITFTFVSKWRVRLFSLDPQLKSH